MALTQPSVAVTYNLTIEQGATWRPDPFVMRDKQTQTPLDLTGCIARMHIRNRLSSPDIILALTTENGRITLGGTAGTIALYISDEDTALLDFSNAVYDIELEYPNGDVVRFMQGAVLLSKEVTRQ